MLPPPDQGPCKLSAQTGRVHLLFRGFTALLKTHIPGLPNAHPWPGYLSGAKGGHFLSMAKVSPGHTSPVAPRCLVSCGFLDSPLPSLLLPPHTCLTDTPLPQGTGPLSSLKMPSLPSQGPLLRNHPPPPPMPSPSSPVAGASRIPQFHAELKCHFPGGCCSSFLTQRESPQHWKSLGCSLYIQ